MNILDENFPVSQRDVLQSWRIRVRQIGSSLGRKGLQDDETIPFLRGFRRPTFFDPEFDTQVKRMGAVIRVTPSGLTVWRLHATTEEHHHWQG